MSTTNYAGHITDNPLFNLPKEIRDTIYSQVFADLISWPLYLRTYPQWKAFTPSRTQTPGILLASKAMYLEARAYLYYVWGPPRIIIDSPYPTLHCRSDKYACPDPDRPARGQVVALRPAFYDKELKESTLLPILNSAQELNLEINALGEDGNCLLLVRWIRAVLNQREIRLRSISIVVHCNNDGCSTPQRRDINREAREIRTQSQPPGDVWIVRRARRYSVDGPPRGDLLRADQAAAEAFLPQSIEWRELCYGEAYDQGKQRVAQRESVVRMRSGTGWLMRAWCLVGHVFDVFYYHDAWFGESAGSGRCCIICGILHILCRLEPRFETWGWPSTKRRLAYRETAALQHGE